MKGHLVFGDAMDARLRRGQQAEYCNGVLLDRTAQGGSLE